MSQFILTRKQISYGNESIDFNNNSEIEITNINAKVHLQALLNKLVLLAYFEQKKLINKTKIDLSINHFKNGQLSDNDFRIKRFVKVGRGQTGAKNNLCDVPGVLVGQMTLDQNDYHTGLTVIKPHQDNCFNHKVVASSFVFNGYGKSVGLVQIDEIGIIETPIVMTSTLNVGKISDAVVGVALEELDNTITSINPVVLECNDGQLNKSVDRILGVKEYQEALANLKTDFCQGAIGAGRGMICHGYKGGIGSSSRLFHFNNQDYYLGIILNSNFGSSDGNELRFLGSKISGINEEVKPEQGSIVCVVATDLPLNERQLKRVLRRIEIGIGRTGSYAGNGSGDLFVGFTTANGRDRFNKALQEIKYIDDQCLDSFFRLVPEVTEEAVLNSMLYAHGYHGYHKEVMSLGKKYNEFINLIDEEIIYK